MPTPRAAVRLSEMSFPTRQSRNGRDDAEDEWSENLRKKRQAKTVLRKKRLRAKEQCNKNTVLPSSWKCFQEVSACKHICGQNLPWNYCQDNLPLTETFRKWNRQQNLFQKNPITFDKKNGKSPALSLFWKHGIWGWYCYFSGYEQE